MCEGTPLEASSDAEDFQVSQLSERITLLREQIVVMVAQDRDTRRQSEKLFVMLRELRAAKLMSALRSQDNAPQDEQGESVQSVSAANRRQQQA